MGGAAVAPIITFRFVGIFLIPGKDFNSISPLQSSTGEAAEPPAYSGSPGGDSRGGFMVGGAGWSW